MAKDVYVSLHCKILKTFLRTDDPVSDKVRGALLIE
jgi:hypothetical protein